MSQKPNKALRRKERTEKEKFYNEFASASFKKRLWIACNFKPKKESSKNATSN